MKYQFMEQQRRYHLNGEDSESSGGLTRWVPYVAQAAAHGSPSNFAGEDFNHGPRYVAFMDEELLVFLWLEPQMEMAVGSFEVPDQIEVWLEYKPEGSPQMEEERAVSGTVVVQTYQEGIGMSGYFSGVQFPDTSGSLAGSFDVTFELNGRMIVGGD